MNPDVAWFENFSKSPTYEQIKQQPIAYFCAEYALSSKLPIYAGGLGILAGDILKEASDRNLPFVGIGLFYPQGYVCQTISDNGQLVEVCTITNAADTGLTPVNDENGKRMYIEVPIQDRKVLIQAWRWQQGNVPLFLLDANVAENDPQDRKITDRLYVSDKETRFKQEMILGIGGVRLLEALKIHPLIYHMNEGHSAMLILDLIRHEKQTHKKSYAQALLMASKHLVFSNHTLVSGGHEVFSNDLASALLSTYALELEVPIKDIIDLGLVQESSLFSMTMLSLRIASRINAVSKLHQKKAKEIWTDHPMDYVTNGIHLPTWNRISSNETLVGDHQKNKQLLLAEIAKQTGKQWSENELLVGWARRLVAYKRPLALFEDKERFRQIAGVNGKKINIVISGQAPPGDTTAGKLIEELKDTVEKQFPDSVVYLPNYNMDLADQMVAGCDVWLNTPVVGFEACGTSGMKAALNGTLPATTKDGWADEVEMYGIGWILESDQVNKSLLDTLEKDIIPMYYDNKPEWEKHMKNGRELILNEFSATKMLRNYVEKMYAPSISTINH